MAFENYIASKKAFIFGFDDVLYPEKDYQLQVYYLFSEFMEYTELSEAKNIVEFMQSEFARHGDVNIFEKTAAKFRIDEKYKSNFSKLHEHARLPLKLLLFQQVLSFMQEVVVERKAIYIAVRGNPIMQLNKIKQIEWHGLEPYLKVYFSEEIEPFLSIKTFDFINNQNDLKKEEILFIGNGLEDQKIAEQARIDFLAVAKLL